jgi:hypothetical protein
VNLGGNHGPNIRFEAGSEGKEACSTDQHRTSLETGVEGSIHAMQKLWAELHQQEEDWVLLLIDVKHAFNSVFNSAFNNEQKGGQETAKGISDKDKWSIQLEEAHQAVTSKDILHGQECKAEPLGRTASAGRRLGFSAH